MVTDEFDTSALDALRSSEQQGLLDEIDSLRLQGISEFIFLPQIVVCGDQSSGKSSVLEAISGVPFPRNDTLCTRFATEVILRDASMPGVAVSILPSQDASDVDRERLLAFKETLQELDRFPSLIERAKSEMGISATGNAFSKNILRVEISGPKKPKLTVVDLPGLIHSDSKQQSPADVELISNLVRSYMKNPRSIILAVVSAKNDFANQIVLKRAREVDHDGLRTLGLITKPDTLPSGSDSEAEFVNLASNDNIEFRLGWHIVKNRDYNSRYSTTEERDQSETKFFSEGVWKDLPRDMVGVGSLRRRLSKILLDQIKRYLPSLMRDIQSSIDESERKLVRLGDGRNTPDEQRRFLLKLSQSFQTLCRAAIDGSYDDKFFGDPSSDEEYPKRLRAVVQNLNLAFSERMRTKGHHRTIRGESAAVSHPETTHDALQPVVMSRTEAIEWVRRLLVRSRGPELPGSFNPLLVGELFRDQSRPWEKITREHVKKIWTTSKDFLERLLNVLTDDETFQALFNHWIDSNTNERFKMANQRLDCLLIDRERRPITYNHYYTEVLQSLRQERMMIELKSRIQSFMGTSSNSIKVYSEAVDVTRLAKSLSMQSESDMDSFACSELLDSMQAYYKVSKQPNLSSTFFHWLRLDYANVQVKVALKTFVDNVSIQVVEDLLIGDLWSIFSPTNVGQMSPDLISKIAAESTESQALRQQLERKLQTLKRGMEICQRHSTHESLG
jgi:GTPase SAR1 family protein